MESKNEIRAITLIFFSFHLKRKNQHSKENHLGTKYVLLTITMGCLKLDISERAYAPMKIVYGGKYGNAERTDFYRQGAGNGSVNLRVVYRVQQSNGGITSSDWASGIGAGVSMAELLRQGKVYQFYGTSAQNVEKALSKGRYVHYNGRNYSQGFRGNQYVSSQSVKSSISTAKFARNLGRGFTALNAGVAIYQFGTSDQSGADYARLAGAGIITATAFIPVVGPFISIGLGFADSFGAFDGIYNSFDD